LAGKIGKGERLFSGVGWRRASRRIGILTWNNGGRVNFAGDVDGGGFLCVEEFGRIEQRCGFAFGTRSSGTFVALTRTSHDGQE